jgi:hypothetical protein
MFKNYRSKFIPASDECAYPLVRLSKFMATLRDTLVNSDGAELEWEPDRNSSKETLDSRGYEDSDCSYWSVFRQLIKDFCRAILRSGDLST